MEKRKKPSRSLFRPQIRSRHPSHNPLRSTLALLPFRSVVRFGSVTELQDDVSHGGSRIECNTVHAVMNSSSKLRMKTEFQRTGVVTAQWFIVSTVDPRRLVEVVGINENGTLATEPAEIPYPIVAKSNYGSRGEGNTLLRTEQEVLNFLDSHRNRNYIFERFYSYSREYRLHVTKNGCFYACRKMLRNDTPNNQRWFRNDSNSVWIMENGSNTEKFDKPTNWNTIIGECVKALKAVGLDIGACDVKVQSARMKNGRIRENPNFIVLETNSAPAFGEVTLEKYKEKVVEILTGKYEEQ